MRAILLVILSGVFFLGCRHPKSTDPAADKSAARGSAARSASPQLGQAVPVNESVGKVAAVNPGLRFVVIDFAFNPPPAVDQRMSVYREGQKVAEVKISSQSRNNIIAADIMAGEAKVGDEVRPE